MFKRILVIGALVALTGCATNQQSGQAIGAVTGAIVGNSVGSGAGKAAATFIGTVVGSEVGRNVGASMDRQNEKTVIIENRSVEHHHPHVVRPASVYPDYSVCEPIWNHQARKSCQRGAEARARQEQNRLNQEAYQRGLQGQ